MFPVTTGLSGVMVIVARMSVSAEITSGIPVLARVSFTTPTSVAIPGISGVTAKSGSGITVKCGTGVTTKY